MGLSTALPSGLGNDGIGNAAFDSCDWVLATVPGGGLTGLSFKLNESWVTEWQLFFTHFFY